MYMRAHTQVRPYEGTGFLRLFWVRWVSYARPTRARQWRQAGFPTRRRGNPMGGRRPPLGRLREGGPGGRGIETPSPWRVSFPHFFVRTKKWGRRRQNAGVAQRRKQSLPQVSPHPPRRGRGTFPPRGRPLRAPIWSRAHFAARYCGRLVIAPTRGAVR